jgi:hypothetical protein
MIPRPQILDGLRSAIGRTAASRHRQITKILMVIRP